MIILVAITLLVATAGGHTESERDWALLKWLRFFHHQTHSKNLLVIFHYEYVFLKCKRKRLEW